MKLKTISVACAVILSAFLITGLSAQTQDDAVKMVKNAIAFLEKNGKARGLAELSKGNGMFVKGGLYAFAYDMNGTIVAHPKNKKLIGKKLINTPDVDGKMFRKDIVEMAKSKGSGWVDYKYMDFKTKKVTPKTTYLEKWNDLIICAGINK